MKMTLQQFAALSLSQIKAMLVQPDPREPASQMNDDSQRMQAIGQNGPTAEHYQEAV